MVKPCAIFVPCAHVEHCIYQLSEETVYAAVDDIKSVRGAVMRFADKFIFLPLAASPIQLPAGTPSLFMLRSCLHIITFCNCWPSY
jgi:hypothetical protein